MVSLYMIPPTKNEHYNGVVVPCYGTWNVFKCILLVPRDEKSDAESVQ